MFYIYLPVAGNAVSLLLLLGLGYETLQPSSEEDDKEDLYRELVRLKESEGLYFHLVGPDRSEESGGRRKVTVPLHIPAKAPQSTYSVKLYGFRDHELVSRGEAVFVLRQAGFTAFVTSLAEDHGLLYGLLAVVVALAAGSGVGFLFGSAGKH